MSLHDDSDLIVLLHSPVFLVCNQGLSGSRRNGIHIYGSGGFLFISKHFRVQGMVLIQFYCVFNGAFIERFERKTATEMLLHFYSIDIIIAI